jgi:hypothetical protein
MIVGSGDWLALFFFESFAQVIGTPTFVHNPENIQHFALDFVIDQIREWATSTAGKSMRTDMVSALPSDHHPNRFLNAFVKLIA